MDNLDYSQFLKMPAEMSLLAVIMVLFIADLFFCGDRKSGKPSFGAWFPVILLIIQMLMCIIPMLTGICPTLSHDTVAFGGMYIATPMMTMVKCILSVGTIIVFLMADGWLKKESNLIKRGEFYIITLFTLLGMFFMISSGHFLMFFIGLELASVPMAALVTFDKYRYESAEAGAKYILLAIFSSSLLLYGISLIYGATGSLYFNEIYAKIQPSILTIAGLILFISGMGFKISLVPFHLWTADTYEGAPTSVTGYLSVISKSSAAFVLMTMFIKAFPLMGDFFVAWNQTLYWLIIASITIANLFAIRQKNLKRFMAFSAISQAGYIVLAIMGGTAQGMSALVFYLLVYMVANLGAFAVINEIEQKSNKISIDDYDGLYETNPKLSFLMTLCLFSLAGIPPFAGMFSKFFVFMAAFRAGCPWLVLIALINTVISLYYYLLIVKAMYIKKNDSPIAYFQSDLTTRVAMTICLVGVVFIGILGFVYSYIDTLSFGL